MKKSAEQGTQHWARHPSTRKELQKPTDITYRKAPSKVLAQLWHSQPLLTPAIVTDHLMGAVRNHNLNAPHQTPMNT